MGRGQVENRNPEKDKRGKIMNQVKESVGRINNTEITTNTVISPLPTTVPTDKPLCACIGHGCPRDSRSCDCSLELVSPPDVGRFEHEYCGSAVMTNAYSGTFCESPAALRDCASKLVEDLGIDPYTALPSSPLRGAQ